MNTLNLSTPSPAGSRRPGSLAAVLALALTVLAPSQGLLRPLADGLLLLAALAALRPTAGPGRSALSLGLIAAAAVALFLALPTPLQGGDGLRLLAILALAQCSVRQLAEQPDSRWSGPATAGLFGLWLLYVWELGVTVFAVPRVLLPAPSLIVQALWDHAATLGGDFVQTVLKSVLIGYLLGNGLGVLTGIAIDRAPFLQRGLQPVAALTSTVPLVGVAPIAVMWFGFDWPSKAAVIVLMTFFPALINTLAGLEAAGKLERELMHSYAAGYRRTLLWLRLPTALPHIFGALKVNATLSLIGAIVAEFFGSPTAGLGFRISTEAARMNMPLVWAAIVVAALTGSGLYALLSRLERRVNFWHPAFRTR